MRWLLCLLAACGANATLPSVRFANAPAVTAVDDRRDVPHAPDTRHVMVDVYGYAGSVEVPIERALELHRQHRARGVNALDEVPDSTWFTNRGPLTPEQIRIGPATGDSPEDHKPWTVRSMQQGGTSHGFIIEDTRGIRYLLKFDRAGFPEIETGIDVVVDRLLWACGYNVPDDRVVYLRPEDLVLPPGSKIGREHVDRTLAKRDHERDGRIRGIVSRYLDGKPIGSPPFEGVRHDDPNDRLPHEQRRDLRGMYAIFAWLDAVDLIPGNFLDMWVTDPADAAHHYVEHYAIDFGKSLGGMGSIGHDLRHGHTYRFDLADMTRTLLTGGLFGRPWAARPVVNIRGVASLFDAASFDPGAWRPDIPFPPFVTADRIDQYWGAKIVARFTREQLHAAVEAARFTDPRAVEYMTDTLLARARKTAAYWYERVAPLERIAVDEGLCFDDLAIDAGFAAAARTRYTIRTYDHHGHELARPLTVTPHGTRTCTRIPATGAGHDGYTILSITTARGRTNATTYVHSALDHGQRRVIGIWRA